MNFFLFIHLVGFALGFGTVLFIDAVGALWVWRKVKATQLMWLSGVGQWLIWLAVALQLVSGAYLLDPSKLTWRTEIKLVAVVILIVNGIVLDQIRKAVIASKVEDFWRLPRGLQLRSVASISLSQACWWTAVIIGFLTSLARG